MSINFGHIKKSLFVINVPFWVQCLENGLDVPVLYNYRIEKVVLHFSIVYSHHLIALWYAQKDSFLRADLM